MLDPLTHSLSSFSYIVSVYTEMTWILCLFQLVFQNQAA